MTDTNQKTTIPVTSMMIEAGERIACSAPGLINRDLAKIYRAMRILEPQSNNNRTQTTDNFGRDVSIGLLYLFAFLGACALFVILGALARLAGIPIFTNPS